MARVVLIFFLGVALWPMFASANFITDWSLVTSINPGNADIESVRFSNVVSPFFDSHTIDLLGSSGDAAYQPVVKPFGKPDRLSS